MNDDRKVAVVGEGEVAVEPILLQGEGSSIPVPVQAGLSDGDDTWASDHIENERPILLAGFGRVVWVNADGRENTLVSCRQLECTRARSGRGADGDDLGHAFRGSAIEEGRQVGANLRSSR